MLRSEVIQAVLDLYPHPNYLEVGVSRGVTFHEINAAYKVAVDPRFCFDVKQAQVDHPNSHYHEITSDAFFQSYVRTHPQFDVIYLDGLHTFEQTLRDLLNSIVYTKAEGVIIIDDVRPISYSSSLRNEPEALMVKGLLRSEADGAWMGDVYRLVYFIETFLPAFSYACVEENSCHQLVMWRQQRHDTIGFDRSVEAVSRLEFCQVLAQQESYRAKPLAGITESIKNASLLSTGEEKKWTEAQPLHDFARSPTAEAALKVLRPIEGSLIDRFQIPVVVSGPLTGGESCFLVSAVEWQKEPLPRHAIVGNRVSFDMRSHVGLAQLNLPENRTGPHVIVIINDKQEIIGHCNVHLGKRDSHRKYLPEEGTKFIFPVQVCRSQLSNWETGDSIPVEVVSRAEFFASKPSSESIRLTVVAADEVIDGRGSLDSALSVGSELPAFQALTKRSAWFPGTTYLASFPDAVVDVKNGIVLFGQEQKAWGDSCVATVFPKGGETRSPALIPIEGQLAWTSAGQEIQHIDIDRPAMMLSHWASLVNYGHWMMNSLLSVYAALAELKAGQIVLLTPVLPERLRNEILQMGVPEQAIIEAGCQYVRLNRLIYPSPLSTRANIQPSTLCLGFFDYIKSKFSKQFDYTPAERIYITRKGYPTLRQMENEDEMIQAMTELGLKCVVPHELSFEEQIYAVSNAKLIVGQLGAALWNLPFTRKGGAVVEICTSNYTTNEYFYISHLMDHRFVRVMTDPTTEGGSFKFVAPVDDVRRIVKSLM